MLPHSTLLTLLPNRSDENWSKDLYLDKVLSFMFLCCLPCYSIPLCNIGRNIPKGYKIKACKIQVSQMALSILAKFNSVTLHIKASNSNAFATKAKG